MVFKGKNRYIGETDGIFIIIIIIIRAGPQHIFISSCVFVCAFYISLDTMIRN